MPPNPGQPMQTCSIAEAKTRLSQLIEMVKSGEEVVLTKQGIAVAKLVRLDHTQRQAENVNKLTDLETFFAPYRKDQAGFKFDREEANAR